jgi:isopenicillin N synthase-like dioxygenase
MQVRPQLETIDKELKEASNGDGVIAYNLTVPIFSLEDLMKGKLIEEFKLALSEKGFFYITDHGITEQEYQHFKNTSLDFLNKNEEEKEAVRIKIPEIRRGYTKLEGESTAQVTNVGTYTDYVTKFSMGCHSNVFPNSNFEEVWTKYFNKIYGVARTIARLIINTLDIELEDVEDFLTCDPLLRFLYYPDVPENRCREYEPLRMAAHYDIDFITLLYQTPCLNGFVSLQAQIRDNFVDIPPIKDTLFVNSGTVLTILSKGMVKSTIHQVRSPPLHQQVGSNRTSAVFFLRPKPDFILPISNAKEYGINISFTNDDKITFGDWVGKNYRELNTASSNHK